MYRYRINQLKLPLDHAHEHIERKICSILGTKTDNIISWKIQKKSWDAREKTNIRIIYAVYVELKNAIRRRGESVDWIQIEKEETYSFPLPTRKNGHGDRPVIVGAGPAGLFCALLLAEHGYAPLVLERGEDAASRLASVEKFWKTGELNPDSNMQFGEGGAGTFSDGKLNTSVGDKDHLNAKIIQELIEAGAPAEIGYLNKPHIGTDYLVRVVQNLRKKIELLGGTVRFNARVTDFEIEGSRLQAVMVGSRERIAASSLVLAIGHSARDTFEVLARSPVSMVQKPFAIGLRIEHYQGMIQRNQYGAFWNHPKVPVADYKLTFQASTGRAVYSFCMCPGGFVVNASSESGMVVCNGMSNFARNESNANSAIVVAVKPEDFGSADVLAGLDYQRRWERAAFVAANMDGKIGEQGSMEPKGLQGFAMPIQRFEDFTAFRPTTALGTIQPRSKGAVALSDLNSCLPDFVCASIKEAIREFDRRIKGFAHPDSILTGVETRTSSPIRMLRDKGLQSNIEGIFPCGEGAGYAGGIMSAAMDGIRVAETIAMHRRDQKGD
jgi:hypothetical protein